MFFVALRFSCLTADQRTFRIYSVGREKLPRTLFPDSVSEKDIHITNACCTIPGHSHLLGNYHAGQRVGSMGAHAVLIQMQLWLFSSIWNWTESTSSVCVLSTSHIQACLSKHAWHFRKLGFVATNRTWGKTKKTKKSPSAQIYLLLFYNPTLKQTKKGQLLMDLGKCQEKKVGQNYKRKGRQVYKKKQLYCSTNKSNMEIQPHRLHV